MKRKKDEMSGFKKFPAKVFAGSRSASEIMSDSGEARLMGIEEPKANGR